MSEIEDNAQPDGSRSRRDLVDILTVAVRPSAWSMIHLFAAPADAPRARRPTDVVQAVLSAMAVGVLATNATDEPGRVGRAVSQVVDVLPDLLNGPFRIIIDAAMVWVAVIFAIALWRRQWTLVVGQVGSAALVFGLVLVLGRLATGEWPDVVDDLFGTDGPVSFPAAAVALVVAVLSVAAPYLSRPFRYLGRWLWIACVIAALALEVADTRAAAAGIALGLWASAIAHLAIGSPGGRPTRAEVEAGLADLRIDASCVGPVDLIDGVAVVPAEDRSGRRFLVRVYGRDAWDGQLIATLWRFVFYRDNAPTLALTRIQQVEHEAVAMLLAERRDVPVTSVVASGRSRNGDAFLVMRDAGPPLQPGQVVTPAIVDGAWSTLGRLHAAGIAHGRIAPAALVLDEDGTVLLTGFSSAQAALEPELVLVDQAQMLATLAVVAGVETAVSSAVQALGADGVAAAAAYVQTAALPTAVRKAADDVDVKIDDLRASAVTASGTTPPDLPRLRRVTWGTLAMGVLLFIAGSALISGLTEVGLDTIVDALGDAAWSIVLIAFVIGQLPRFANALALMAASPTPLPFGRVAALQFAITFVNLAMPSTAARVAVNIRFFRKAGVNPATATAIGAVDGFAGFVCQMILIATIVLFSLGSLELGISDRIDLSSYLPLIMVLGGLLVLVITVFAVVPGLRRKIVDAVRPALTPLVVLRSPRRALRLLAANMAAELLFSLAMYTVLRAFDQNVAYIDVVLINVAVALFAGLMPVPGGIGVTEAALTAGFIAAGVPEATAFAAALTYRFVTYYTPPILGFPSMRWLQRQGYL